MAREVTERTRRLRAQTMTLAEAQFAVQDANERFADLYDFVPIPYLIVSGTGVIQHANEAALSFFGGERDWIVRRPLIGYVHTPDMRRVLDHVLSSSSSFSQLVEVRLRARDGIRLVQLLTRRRRHDEALDRPATFHIAIVDLTEVRSLEEQRRRAEEEQRKSQEAERVARAASEAKDEFLAMLSHEMRTPLTPILAAADALVAHAALPEAARSRMEIIRRNVKVEARLIDDLLDVARITKRRLEVNRRPIDLHSVLAETLDGWVAPLEQRGIALDVRLEASTWVQGDAARLGQVWHNIISNAARFTESGGRIAVTSDTQDGRIRVTVADTGVGMTKVQLGALFRPFQPPVGEGSVRHGLGLGLVISRALVEGHEGTLDVQSAGAGSGTTVTVELPVIAPPPATNEEPAEPTAVSPTAKILLVEDDHDSADMLGMLLSLEGFQVEPAGSLHAALKLVDGCDVLVSDIALPDGSGLDLMREIRAKGSSMRGIALSGYGGAKDIRRSLDAGFEEHLTKPVDLEHLVTAVRRLTEPRP